MKNSNIINIHKCKINSNYYNIGLIIGALRAELENGSIELESAYELLTDRTKSALENDLACVGGIIP